MPLLGFGLLALFSGVQGTDAMKPRPQWLVRGISIAVREELLPRYTYGIYRGDTINFATRYEAAVYIHGAVTKHLERLENALEGDPRDTDRASLIRSNSLLPFYRRGKAEFAKEFANLGMTDDFGIDRVEILGKRFQRHSPARTLPFSDVKFEHWAAKAVGDLRALGLLDGYPDGSFRG